jgi:hypothetical protein
MKNIGKEFQKILSIDKHNALTDGFILKTGKAILPDKLLNALYWKYEQSGTEFEISMSELRLLLDLKNSKDDERIYSALHQLSIPMQIRNFVHKDKNIIWALVSFINEATRRKETQNYISITISEKMISVLKQKQGYTILDIKTCNRFKTKYGLKLYEMYLRYYHLPNREGKGIGKISKSLEELNNMFGTNYKHPSKLLNMKITPTKTIAPINRGLNEIEKITKETIGCFYNKIERKFIFAWHQKEKYPKLRIPYNRIDELIDWYLKHNKELKINSIPKYKAGLKKKIIEDEFNELDKLYKGMLQWKYNLTPSDYFDVESGRYRDF